MPICRHADMPRRLSSNMDAPEGGEDEDEDEGAGEVQIGAAAGATEENEDFIIGL